MKTHESDALYEAAKKIVVEQQKASSVLLQRILKIGYVKAAHLLDMLEERGVVSRPVKIGVAPHTRKVLVSSLTPFGDYEEPEHKMYRLQKERITRPRLSQYGLTEAQSIHEFERKIDDELNFLTQDGYGGNWSEDKKLEIKKIMLLAYEAGKEEGYQSTMAENGLDQ